VAGLSTSLELLVQGVSLDVQSPHESGHNPTFGRASDTRHRHDEFALETSNCVSSARRQYEVGCPVEPTRVLLDGETERARAGLRIDPHFLDPGEAVRAQQALGNRVELSGEFVPESENGDISVRTIFKHLRAAQVGKGEAEMKGGLGQHRGDGLF
jgi:hypothetical protein